MTRMVPSTFIRWWLLAVCALTVAFFALRNSETPKTDNPYDALDSESAVGVQLAGDGHLTNETALQGHQNTERGLSIGSTANYKRCKETGPKILCAFDNPSRAPATSFTSFSQLENWGWTQTDLQGFTVSAELEDYAAELDSRGFNVQSPPMRGIKWEHTKETTHGQTRYPATGGVYQVLFDPNQGLIVPAFSYGPAWQVAQKTGRTQHWRDGDPLPDLRSWSGIAYLTWLQYSTPQNRQKLSMIASIDSTNDITRSVVQEALKKDGVKSGVPPKWPGHTFSQGKRKIFSSSPDGIYAAVLGTPNLLGSGWLVLQHTALGNKKIGDITVYDSSEAGNDADDFQLSILVEVVDKTT